MLLYPAICAEDGNGEIDNPEVGKPKLIKGKITEDSTLEQSITKVHDVKQLGFDMEKHVVNPVERIADTEILPDLAEGFKAGEHIYSVASPWGQSSEKEIAQWHASANKDALAVMKKQAKLDWTAANPDNQEPLVITFSKMETNRLAITESWKCSALFTAKIQIETQEAPGKSEKVIKPGQKFQVTIHEKMRHGMKITEFPDLSKPLDVETGKAYNITIRDHFGRKMKSKLYFVPAKEKDAVSLEPIDRKILAQGKWAKIKLGGFRELVNEANANAVVALGNVVSVSEKIIYIHTDGNQSSTTSSKISARIGPAKVEAVFIASDNTLCMFLSTNSVKKK